jgi:hypothetical protein
LFDPVETGGLTRAVIPFFRSTGYPVFQEVPGPGTPRPFTTGFSGPPEFPAALLKQVRKPV